MHKPTLAKSARMGHPGFCYLRVNEWAFPECGQLNVLSPISVPNDWLCLYS
jgi:hypothetical protein